MSSLENGTQVGSKGDHMNELWMDLGYGFLYYQTDNDDLESAMDEFLEKLSSIGCVSDNFGWEGLELRIDGDCCNVKESCGVGSPSAWQNKTAGALEKW